MAASKIPKMTKSAFIPESSRYGVCLGSAAARRSGAERPIILSEETKTPPIAAAATKTVDKLGLISDAGIKKWAQYPYS
jgi:hypothetical protein